jgi:hypothetical protein
MDNSDLQATIGNAGLRYVQKTYDWAMIASQLLDIYQRGPTIMTTILVCVASDLSRNNSVTITSVSGERFRARWHFRVLSGSSIHP